MPNKSFVAQFNLELLECRRLLSAGMLDTGFGTDGIKAISDLPSALLAGPNGGTYAVGNITIDGQAGIYVSRYNANGSIDTTFAQNGAADVPKGYAFVPTTATFSSAAVAPDGDIDIDANVANQSQEPVDGIFIRLTSSGILDPSFGTKGIDEVPIAQPIYGGLGPLAINSSGTIFAVFGSNVIRVNPNGSLDAAADYNFANAPVFQRTDYSGYYPVSVAVDSSDNILVGLRGPSFCRFDGEGQEDMSLGTGGIASFTVVGGSLLAGQNIVPLQDGMVAVIYSVGGDGAHDIPEYGPPIIIEFLSNGSLNPSFGDNGVLFTNPDPTNPIAPPYADNFDYTIQNVMLQPDGKIIVAGHYLSPAAISAVDYPEELGEAYMVRITDDGKIDTTFSNNGNLLTGNGPIYAGYSAPFTLLSTGDVELAATVNGQPALIRYTAYTPVSPTVTGTVFSDTVGAGQFIANQSGVANQTVYADLNDNGKLDPGEPKTLTDSHGNYTLSNLPNGPLIIRQVLQTGQRQSAPSAGGGDHVVAAANAVVTANFETTTKAYLSGTIFNDKNANGKLDPGEPGLPGWTVYVDLNHDGKLDAGDISTLTNSTGGYSFYQLSAGTYTLRVAPPPPSANWKSTSSSGSLAVKLQSGQVATNYNFGFTPIAMPMADNDLLSLRAIF